MAEVHHERAYFTGRVQGVGFRYAALQVAREFEVSGFVSNLPDGRVVLEAEGVPDQVDAFYSRSPGAGWTALREEGGPGGERSLAAVLRLHDKVTTADPAPPPSPWRIWISASRPRTLPAAVAPVLVGSALAGHDHRFDPAAACLCLLFALLVQIGTNFANDYYDFIHGADARTRASARCAPWPRASFGPRS